MSTSTRSRSRSISASRSPSPYHGLAQDRSASGRKQGESEDEGEAPETHAPESLGSGAMSESESDHSISAPHEEEDMDEEGVLYPLDGKFVSESDRAEIMGLPEIRREEILAERAHQMEEQRISLKLRQRAQAQEKQFAKAAERHKRKAAAAELEENTRTVARPRTKASEALDQLKKSRADKAERSRTGESNARSKTDQLFDNEDEDEIDSDPNSGPAKMPAMSYDQPATIKDFTNVLVGRTNYADICYTPGYEDAISGCFIRVCLGPDTQQGGRLIYRLCQVKSLTTGRPYAVEGRSGRILFTDQWAVTSHGKSERKWEMKSCSDKSFTEAEFEQYKKNMVDSGKKLPTSSFLHEKLEQLKALKKHIWSDAEISHKLNRSAQLQNPTTDRTKLLSERKQAEDEGDEAALARIDRKLASAESAKTLPQVSSHGNPTLGLTQQDRLARINLANRKANIENIRRAQIEEKKQAQAILRGEGKANRLERVRTVAKTFHNANINKGSRQADDLFGDASDLEKTATSVASRAGTPMAAKIDGSKKRKQTDDEVMAALDLDIDVHI